jgi:hypothetical protein
MAEIGGTFAASRTSSNLGVSAVDPAETKRRRRAQAEADERADKQNLFGSGRPDGAKRRPQRPQGNSRQALLRRLRRDHPELHRLVLSGEVTPFRAAVVAGFRKPPGKKPQRPVDPTEQGHSEILLELWLGPHPDRGSVFETREQLEAAWLRHKAEVMARWAQRCHRPAAYWELELCEDHPGYDREPAVLHERGLLTEAERADWSKSV